MARPKLCDGRNFFEPVESQQLNELLIDETVRPRTQWNAFS
jgi:hypothetical protein